jgi:histidine triad (HIT) family protein
MDSSTDGTSITHAPDGYVCPFCQIVRGIESERTLSTAANIVYQDQEVTAMVSLHQWPRNPGNVLVLPNEHYENIYQLPPELGAALQRAARLIALAMKAVWSCDGVSTRQHNEPAGNQDVWHYHLHVTPRHAGDDFYASYGEGPTLMPAEDRAQLARRLREWLENNEGG